MTRLENLNGFRKYTITNEVFLAQALSLTWFCWQVSVSILKRLFMCPLLDTCPCLQMPFCLPRRYHLSKDSDPWTTFVLQRRKIAGVKRISGPFPGLKESSTCCSASHLCESWEGRGQEGLHWDSSILMTRTDQGQCAPKLCGLGFPNQLVSLWGWLGKTGGWLTQENF